MNIAQLINKLEDVLLHEGNIDVKIMDEDFARDPEPRPERFIRHRHGDRVIPAYEHEGDIDNLVNHYNKDEAYHRQCFDDLIKYDNEAGSNYFFARYQTFDRYYQCILSEKEDVIRKIADYNKAPFVLVL